MTDIQITLISDEKGYYDRECPSCDFIFKVYLEDWKNKVKDDEVHCPRCGHISTSDKWYTKEQILAMKEIALGWAKNYLSKSIEKSFNDLERKTRTNKYFKITYKSNRMATFQNNPIGQRREWELEIACEKCFTRYSVIGSAYFCPCCGHSSIKKVLDESFDRIESMISSIPEMKVLFSEKNGIEKAQTMCDSLLESSLGDIVSTFQQFACEKYKDMSGKDAQPNEFQIIAKGSSLFKDAHGKDYSYWCANEEIVYLNLMFQQRHLFEHCNGIVDEKYLKNSKDDKYQIGQRLVIEQNDVTEFIRICKKLCNGLKSL